MKAGFGFVLLMIASAAQAQQKDAASNLSMGVEVDALPYLTGGYYGSIWVGRDHIRYRAIVTKITTPPFMLDDGFTNNKIQSYTAIADYFFSTGFEKWWVGAGAEYWRGTFKPRGSWVPHGMRISFSPVAAATSGNFTRTFTSIRGWRSTCGLPVTTRQL